MANPRRIASGPRTLRDFAVQRRFYREAAHRAPLPPAPPPPMCSSTLDGAPCIHIAGSFHGDTHHDIADREWTSQQEDKP